jgi:hypothetical protein
MQKDNQNEKPQNKQDTFAAEINTIINKLDTDTLSILLKNALIVTTEQQEIMHQAIVQKIPYYNGHILISKTIYKKDKLSQFRQLLYPGVEYNQTTETKFLESSRIVFPATITPCWSWDNNSKKLIQKDNIGIVFCNGVNFSTTKTADYTKFAENTKELDIQIFLITSYIVEAPYQLTKKANKTVCNLKIPKIGLGEFAKCYSNKKQLTDLYIKNIHQELFNISAKDTTFSWLLEFFNYDNNQNYNEIIKKYFTPSNAKKFFWKILVYYKSSYSIFKQMEETDMTKNFFNALKDKNHLTVIAHSSNQHAFLGGMGYNDTAPLDKQLAGHNNDDYLTAIHLFNLFMPEVLNNPKIEEITINNHEEKGRNQEKKQAKKKVPKRLYWAAGIFLTATLIIALYLERENIKTKISNLFDSSTKIKNANYNRF